MHARGWHPRARARWTPLSSVEPRGRVGWTQLSGRQWCPWLAPRTWPVVAARPWPSSTGSAS
eukprot:2904864-Lingulodinium_polyedra.AAC.1